MAKAETLHEALASLAIFSTKDRDAQRRRLWRDAECLGDFNASEAWALVHQLRTA